MPILNHKQKNEAFGPQVLFSFVCLVVSIRIAVRCFQNFSLLNFDHLQDPHLQQGFFISLGVYLFFAVLAFFYSKLLDTAAGHAFYLGLLFFVYLLTLLNLSSLRVYDVYFIRGCFVLLLFLLSVAAIWGYKDFRLKPKGEGLGWIAVLIGLWFLHSLIYFLEYNFNPQRVAYGDENSLWAISADVMISSGVLMAHTTGYPGGGSHPLGIPFISALPAIFLENRFSLPIFFMPLVVIVAILMFLVCIRGKKWSFLFFFIGLFSVFHDRGWLSELMYHLVYGEGISTVYFLAVLHSLVIIDQKDKVSWMEIFLMSFIIGLMALTKSPLTLMAWIFFVFFLFMTRGHFLQARTRRWGRLLLCCLLFLLPFLVWMSFRAIYNVPSGGGSIGFVEVFSRLGKPNCAMADDVIRHFFTEGENFAYFAAVSLGFILVSRQRKLIIYSLPVIIFAVSVIFYYAYIFNYGEASGDYASGLRYLMPMSMGLFYIGSLGFESIMGNIEKRSWHPVAKIAVCLPLIGIIVSKLF